MLRLDVDELFQDGYQTKVFSEIIRCLTFFTWWWMINLATFPDAFFLPKNHGSVCSRSTRISRAATAIKISSIDRICERGRLLSLLRHRFECSHFCVLINHECCVW